jgi:hydroxymethylbilane synthase
VRAGCVIGAGSLRRQALVRLYAPAAVPTLIRGNVPTRVEKCRGGQYGAVLLARAGLERLGLDLSGLVVYRMLTHAWIPAPGQGAVAVEVRADDAEAVAVVSAIDHPATTEAVTLERELLARFEGGCHTAFGAHAVKSGDGWTVAVGMDRGEAGWGQTLYSGSRARCADHSPADLPGFAAVAVSRQEDLCVPYRP